MQGLEVDLYVHAELCCLTAEGLLVLLPWPGRIQTDQQWLQINPFFNSTSDDIGLSTFVLPQWLFLNLRTKCTTLLMTCRGMLTCLILTPIWHCTGSLLRIQKVGQTHLYFLVQYLQCFLTVLHCICPWACLREVAVFICPVCSLLTLLSLYFSFLERGCWWVLLEKATNRASASVQLWCDKGERICQMHGRGQNQHVL